MIQSEKNVSGQIIRIRNITQSTTTIITRVTISNNFKIDLEEKNHLTANIMTTKSLLCCHFLKADNFKI